MERKMKPVFDPKLQDEIPAWVITHIAEVSAWMKTRGHAIWSIGGIGPLPDTQTLLKPRSGLGLNEWLDLNLTGDNEMAEKQYHIVWNSTKTEGYITDSEDDAEFARSGFQANFSSSTLALAMREAYADGEDDDETELPAQSVAIEV